MTEPLRITSRQNPRVKSAALLRNARERQRSGRFIIDGAREIVRALASEIAAAEAFVCEDLIRTAEAAHALALVEASKAEIFRVSAGVYSKLAFGDRDDGIIVVAKQLERSLNELKLPGRPILAVLEAIEKPGNLGAILRSADAAGVDAVVSADGRSDLFNPNTIRASLGTVFGANVCSATTAETIDWLRNLGLPIIAARPDASMLYTEANLKDGAAIVLGSEAHGLGEAWRATGTTPVRLPMHGIADSLNVSTTAAVLFYEALRQRS
jgi:TrmH family RNA methyltransferase